MPDVPLAGPVLEDHMSQDAPFTGGVEPMIDAKQAAASLRLPYYWFADPAMRNRYRIPHYLLGGLVRYRLSELSAWAARSTAAHKRDALQTDGVEVGE
jgi:hypothetical protein